MRERRDLKTVSDDRLLRGLFDVLKQTRHDEADLVAHIAEVDARKLYAREAAHSMFAYCTETLHLSEPEAALRIRVARASRKHPILLAMLRAGRIHLSGIALLAPLLTRKNRAALLKRATHRSKRQIEQMVAELRPAPEMPVLVRRLPRGGAEEIEAPVNGTRLEEGGVPGPLPCPEAAGPPGTQVRSDGAPSARPGLDAPVASTGKRHPDAVASVSASHGRAYVLEQRPDAVALVSPQKIMACGSQPRSDSVATEEATFNLHPAVGRPKSPPLARPATVEPVGPARFRVRFDASADLRNKLERLQALTRSSVPDGDLAKVIELAVTRELERLEARRFAKTKKPRARVAQTDTRPKSRYIPAAVRRFVEKRDGGRCTYRDKHGRRCTKRHDLEFHHRKPFGLGGEDGALPAPGES
jgi:hypothetical protein